MIYNIIALLVYVFILRLSQHISVKNIDYGDQSNYMILIDYDNYFCVNL